MHAKIIKKIIDTTKMQQKIDTFLLIKDKKQNTYHLCIPDNQLVREPIKLHIDNKITKPAELFLIVGKNSQVSFLEELKSKKIANFRIKLLVDEGAEVSYYAVQNNQTNFVIDRKATIKKNAKITWYDINLNDSEGTTEIFTSLDGGNAQSIVYGIFMANKEKKLNVTHTTQHNAPDTISRMESKIILNDSARADYKGLISIPHQHPNCRGEENTIVLLLSPNAKIETLPELDIGNNLVKCTHAVSISYLDKEKMFYLNSRGVDPKEATQILTTAFLTPIVDTIKNDTIRQILNTQL